MVQSATFPPALPVPTRLPLEASFDGGRLTADGGLPWLAEAALGLCAAFAAAIPEWRRGPGHHPLPTLIRQRVLQIACGYADQDDADALRRDPLLKWVCGRRPERGADLASQPTFSRLGNAVDGRTCARLADVLFALYLRERERAGRPRRIVLDLDGTDDPTYGAQEGTAYHGHFRQHMYFPLLIFDGDTGQLIAAALHHGNAHAGRGRVGRASPSRCAPTPAAPCPPSTPSARPRASPTPSAWSPTPGSPPWPPPLGAAALRQQAETGAAKVRLVDEVRYQAGSWPHARRVVVKAEALPQGPNTRFVVTNQPDPPTALYDWYVDRGAVEGWIKDLKNACFADRLSDHRFWANQFRLLLHAAAYWLLDTLRRWLAAAGVPRMQLDTLRLRLLKVGGTVQELARCVALHLASGHPGELLWRLLAARPGHR